MTTATLLERTTGQLLMTASELAYDYEQIPEPDRNAVRTAALGIKPRLRRAAEDIFVIGDRLLAIKDRLPRGQWLPWLEIEFEMHENTARNFMRVAERLGDESTKFVGFGPSVLYMLAAPSTPDTAVEAVVERKAKAGKVTYTEAKEIIEAEKPTAADPVYQVEPPPVRKPAPPRGFVTEPRQWPPPAGSGSLPAVTPDPQLTVAEMQELILRWLEESYPDASPKRRVEHMYSATLERYKRLVPAGRHLPYEVLNQAKRNTHDRLIGDLPPFAGADPETRRTRLLRAVDEALRVMGAEWQAEAAKELGCGDDWSRARLGLDALWGRLGGEP